jgi:hypothetical protein
MSNINEWLSADVISGEGNKDVTLTADAYNGANNRTTRLAVVGRNKTKYVNIIQLKEGDAEIPTDVVNCFYVSPTTIAGTKVTIIGEGSIYYFINNEWREVQVNTPITINKRTYFKDFNNTENNYLSLKGLCNVGGNIETLLGEMKDYYAYKLFVNSDIIDASNLILPATTLSKYAYRAMFYGNKYLIKTPTLPATNLDRYCYYGMFQGCTSLVSAPSLPATSLRGECYAEMFKGCTSLVNAPSLPATWVAQYSYYGMFEDCSSLVVAPSLPSTQIGQYAYYKMFKGCSSLSTAPSLPATTLADACYGNMFWDCTSLRTPPALPATTLTNSCYYGMFDGCINLETAPVLEATELKDNCYAYMFQGCSKINYIKMLATTLYGIEVGDDFSLREWVDGVAEYGTFVKHPDMDSLTKGINGIPTLWNVEDDERYIEFSVNVDSIDLTNNSTATINVTSNTKWSVEYDSNWFVVSPTSGEGDGNVVISRDFYNKSREGNLNFVVNDKIVKNVNIVQYYAPNVDDNDNYFYFEPIETELSITLILSNTYGNNDKVEYFDNNTFTWKTLKAGNTITVKSKTYFRKYERAITIIKKKNEYGMYVTYTYISSHLVTSNLCNIGGNIETLLGEMRENYAHNLFNGGRIAQIVNADNLYFPSTLSDECDFNSMFLNISTLVSANFEIPQSNTNFMFQGCSNLINPPIMTGEKYDTSKCQSMYEGCSLLKVCVILATIDKSPYEGYSYNMGIENQISVLYISPNATDDMFKFFNKIQKSHYYDGYVAPNNVEITCCEGMDIEIEIFSNTNWRLGVDKSWLSLNTNQGYKNQKNIVLTINKPNELYENGKVLFYINEQLCCEYEIKTAETTDKHFYVEPISEIGFGLRNEYDVNDCDARALIKVGENGLWRKYERGFVTNQRIYIYNLTWNTDIYFKYSPFTISGRFNIGGNFKTLLFEGYGLKLFSGWSGTFYVINANNAFCPEGYEINAIGMFAGSETLETTPVFRKGDFTNAFNGCVNLREMTFLDVSYYNNYGDTVKDVNKNGIFYKNPNISTHEYDYFSNDEFRLIPEGWEVRDYEGDI